MCLLQVPRKSLERECLPRGAEGALEQWSQSRHLFIRSAMSNLTALIPLIGTVIDCFVWITNFR